MFNITNFSEHPTNPLYTVYKFKSIEESSTFQKLLAEQNLFYEADETENTYGLLYIVVVKNKDENQTTKLNYIAIGKYRKPLISNKIVRSVIYTFTVILLGSAIVGFFLSG
ncbi:MAG: hypothetical protein JKY53_01530 [Flavobacteriales bacterium]|nr:hypothetical protein [Flavobacteriales bacterium]